MGLDNPLHIAFLLVILLLVFGARRLPEIGRSLGSGLREFKQSINGDSERQTLAPVVPPAHAPVQQSAQPIAAQQAVAQPGETQQS
ncbi:MAG: twin-arginine translocase TatA/TatE family subunit [Solirubrobacteraceae bacterium]